MIRLFHVKCFCDIYSFWFPYRRLAFSQCYFVNDHSLCPYIKQWISPEQITSFDVSHCYWISPEILLNAISLMSQLNELSIQDTRLNLVHLSKIFETCDHITKIGISLVEPTQHKKNINHWKNLEFYLGGEFSTTLETLSKSFGKLKSLKILAFNSTYYINNWLVILQLLR